MFSLIAGAVLGFSTLPDPVCVCGNFPLYMTANEAGDMGHEMCLFGTTMFMPHGGQMPMGENPDYSCPSDYENASPAGVDCSEWDDASC